MYHCVNTVIHSSMIEKQIKSKKPSSGAVVDRLYDAILELKTKKECAAFFRDLCTLSELKAMSERFAVAEKIAKDLSYRGIADATGASTTTVTRVAHWYHHGQGGYRTVISRIQKT